MTATFTITGDLRSAIGDTTASRSVYVELSTEVRDTVSDTDWAFGARTAADNGLFSIDGIPAWDPLNLPYDPDDAPFSVTVSAGTKSWTIPAQLDGAVVDITAFPGPWGGPPAPTDSVVVDNIVAALLGGVSASRTAVDLALLTVDPALTQEFPVELYDPGVYAAADGGPALQDAIDAAIAAGGGTIVIRRPITFSTAISLNNTTATIAFRGPSGSYNVGSFLEGLRWTGTGSGVAIDCHLTRATTFEKLSISYNSASFTGTLIDLSGAVGVADGSQHRIRDCLIRPEGTLDTHAKLVNLDACSSIDIDNTILIGSKALYGKSSDSSFSNRVRVTGGYIQGRGSAPVWNPDMGWVFDSVTTEPLTSGAPGFINHTAGVHMRSITLRDCYMGDDTVAGAWSTINGGVFTQTGNLATAMTSGSSIVKVDDSGSAAGITLGGFEVTTHASAYLIDLGATTGHGRIKIDQLYYATAAPTALINGTGYSALEITASTGVRTLYGGLNFRGSTGVKFYAAAADTQPVLGIDSAGALTWGPGGSTAIDTNWSRIAAGVVGTTGKLAAGGAATASATDIDFMALNADTLVAIRTSSGANFRITAKNDASDVRLQTQNNVPVSIGANGVVGVKIIGTGSTLLGVSAPATTATDGFPHISAVSGTPTGVASSQTGFRPMVFDTSANKFWVYNSGWKGVVLS